MRICSVDGCDKKLHSTGLCAMHYTRNRRFGSADLPVRSARPIKAARLCDVDGCDGRHKSLGYCSKHYDRLRKHGSTDTTAYILGDDNARFDSYVELIPETSCHWWAGNSSSNGYGSIRIEGKHALAHRYAYARAHGPIPKGEGYHGTVVMHTCDNKLCVNPEHLVLGSQSSNLDDMVKKGRGAKGVKSGKAKLTESDIARIRFGGESTSHLASALGVGCNAILCVRTRKTWRHIA